MENNVIARTGRVQSWIDDPAIHACPSAARFLCVTTVWTGPNGIEASWRYVSPTD